MSGEELLGNENFGKAKRISLNQLHQPCPLPDMPIGGAISDTDQKKAAVRPENVRNCGGQGQYVYGVLWYDGFQVREHPNSRFPDLNATDAEVRAAIDALSKADAIRIKQFARKRGQLLQWRVGGPTWEDLIQEAVTRALTGSRRWNKSVPFVSFLLGIIRSISSHSARQISKRKEISEIDLITEDHEGVERNPFALAETAEPDPHEELTAQELLVRIDALFDKDAEALLVIAGMREGLTGPEIRELLELDQRKHETIVKRIRRTLRRKL